MVDHTILASFVQLTWLLEDAAAVACDGPKANLGNHSRHKLAAAIDEHLEKADNALADIWTQLNR